ncbi:MAG: NAD(P)/FAD-dependent oxidoreductase [Saprospiraceae bacterium]
MEIFDCIIIGGGAAGYMAAITVAETKPGAKVLILERGKDVLQKVLVSGGGRCNVTHDCSDPQMLVNYYPRGKKELLSPFTRFGQPQTVEWFSKRGVLIKKEADGRMFPISDDSKTIINCLQNAANKGKVELRTGMRVSKVSKEADEIWKIDLTHHAPLFSKTVFLGSGSNPAIWKMLEELGHSIVPPVPSLFTFNIKDPRLKDLMGVSKEKVGLSIKSPSNADKKLQKEAKKLKETGSLLITHWGLSGFGILRLSAWGARVFETLNYQFELVVDWLPELSLNELEEAITDWKQQNLKKRIIGLSPFQGISARLWASLSGYILKDKEKKWADISKSETRELLEVLNASTFKVNGKSTFKEEFVTAGGVVLKEIDFKNFESKLFPGLYMAGEVLNIDAVTGGFNFQAAWTGAYLAGKGIAERLEMNL